MLNRPNWNDYFLEMAELASTRSPDAQTKCGCVIVDDKNRILGQGYNGFPRGLDDDVLPNTRPKKYAWMIHAEVNPILNSNSSLEGAIAYVTTVPCFNCLILMWQKGISKVYYSKNGSKPHMIDATHEELTEKFIGLSGMEVIGI